MHMPRRVIALPRKKDLAATANLPHPRLLLPFKVTLVKEGITRSDLLNGIGDQVESDNKLKADFLI